MKAKLFGILYVCVAIFTFGHALNNSAVEDSQGTRPLLAFVGGIGWPLYWSWVLQRKIPATDGKTGEGV